MYLSEFTLDKYQNIKDTYPFLTLLRQGSKEYIGIVQNSNEKFITFYDFDSLKSKEEKQVFLELGNKWYWESNRQLPINIFLFDQMKVFSSCIKTILLKEVEIVFGPTTSLENILKKRIKRKTMQLVRKV
jgi:hypothetical protein